MGVRLCGHCIRYQVQQYRPKWKGATYLRRWYCKVFHNRSERKLWHIRHSLSSSSDNTSAASTLQKKSPTFKYLLCPRRWQPRRRPLTSNVAFYISVRRRKCVRSRSVNSLRGQWAESPAAPAGGSRGSQPSRRTGLPTHHGQDEEIHESASSLLYCSARRMFERPWYQGRAASTGSCWL